MKHRVRRHATGPMVDVWTNRPHNGLFSQFMWEAATAGVLAVRRDDGINGYRYLAWVAG